ncbi:helix-turn-helix domain-containing protein [Enterococcus sp. AZ103]|uniref:helix-turn-helix domain-containing protein n=1 Tax=Enterococcus sp. AZ103 TaxID=2774628 RepID=UPI003F282C95
MKNKKMNLSQNLIYLRKSNHYSIETVAEKIGVSRQAVSKWEAGETIPDLINCDLLAQLYDVSLEDLIYYSPTENIPLPPKNKHIFGTVVLAERGQVVLPKAARDLLQLKAGDRLMVLGDSATETQGLALIPADHFLRAAEEMMDNFYPKTKE